MLNKNWIKLKEAETKAEKTEEKKAAQAAAAAPKKWHQARTKRIPTSVLCFKVCIV